MRFDNLGFKPAYAIAIDPPYPGDGDWGMLEIHIGQSGDLVVQVRPSGSEPWVAFFGTERRGLLVGAYACPNPQHLLVCTGMEAVLIDTTAPGHMTELGVIPTTGVLRTRVSDLVAVASFTSVAAIDRHGLRWRSARLFLDDCEFVHGDDGNVHVRGSVSYPGDDRFLTLDAVSGAVVTGAWTPDQVPGQDSVPWSRDS